MNKDQQKTLDVQKNVVYYESVNIVTDVTTGEIVSQQVEVKAKTQEEPDFIKLYYKTMLAFNGADDIPLKFVLSISSFMSWTNDGEPMIFQNSKVVKEQVCKACDIKDTMYARYIKRCCDNGLLFPVKGYRGTYEVNPFFIAKGKWASIKQLRTSFDFAGGKWERTIETELRMYD